MKMTAPQRYRYRVEGFGKHVDFKVLEFLDYVEEMFVCSYCGIVKKELYALSCLHVTCESCKSKFRGGVCLIDKKKYLLCSELQHSKKSDHLREKKVRCLNAHSGCSFTGPLWILSDHLSRSCEFYLTTCSKCEGAVAFKDIMQHYSHCKGRGDETVVLAAADARSLLEDFGNARSELQRALDSTTTGGGEELRAAVASLSEQFARLQGRLAVPEADTVASGLSHSKE